MSTRLSFTFTFAFCFFAWSAQAQDFSIRITQEGFDAMRPAALMRLPSTFRVPSMERQLFNCPVTSSDIVAQVPDVDVGVGWRDVRVTAEDGALAVEAEVDLDIDTTVEIDRVYACFGHATCDVTAGADALSLRVVVAGSSSESGIALEATDVALDLAPEDLSIDSSGCAVGDAAEWLIETFRSWVVERLLSYAESALSEKVASGLEGLIAQAVDLEIERAGFSIHGSVDSLSIHAGTGVELSGSVGVRWAGAPVYDAPAPAIGAPEGVALPAEFGPGQFQLAVSDRLATAALYEAWRGGLLSSALEGRLPTIELDSLGVSQQLGLPEATQISMTIDLTEPLVASFDRDGSGHAKVEITNLVVDLHVLPPWPLPASEVRVRVDGSVALGVAIDPSLGGLVPEVGELDIERVTIETEGAELEIDRARIAEFVRGRVTPILAERFSGVPIAPALASIAGVFAYVRTLETEGGWERAGVDLVTADPNDHDPPSTLLVEPAALVAAGSATFLATGEDGSTPTPLLRYRAFLDGEQIVSGSSVRAIRVDVADGEHQLSVAAIDLNGNEDPTPFEHSFVADGLPPELLVNEAPESLVNEPEIEASWEVHDSGPTESRYELRKISGDGASSEVVADAPFAADRGSLAIDGLEPGALYELEIVARDQAGNVVSQTFGFAVDPNASSGCSAATPDASSFTAIALALGLLSIRRRRR
jgi:uncharacterized protein (TIGR03382 family)